jgi:hypothetical protein
MLTITVAGSVAHSAPSTLLMIRLTLASDAPLGASPLTLAEAQIHDGLGRDFATSALAKTVNRSDGSLTVRGVSPTWVVSLPHIQR